MTGGDFETVGRRRVFYSCEFALSLALLAMQIAIKHHAGSHVRRLLDNEFTCSRLDETPAQFAARMEAVQAFMNSPDFAREGGGRGLAGLARELRSRCELVLSRKGERIPK